jgi:hypothetical protein
MAGRIVAQLIVQGVALFSRSFLSAYQQALQSEHFLFFMLKVVYPPKLTFPALPLQTPRRVVVRQRWLAAP